MTIKASEPVANLNPTQNSSSRTLKKSSKLEREKPSSNFPRNSVLKPPSWVFDPSTNGVASGTRFSYRFDTFIATIPSRATPHCSVTAILSNSNQSIRTRCKP
ncbi:hypothetical protein Fot_12659 [Forsythia ovata]|uniref:Uncharacterized protein n=1 Tax=Forsythia ovata TaxID=205694 RepID=A0ABD1WN63_9LAMI